jgi:hypothetical protein
MEIENSSINNKVKELDQQFDIKYQEVCNLNQERLEKSTP